MPNDSVLEGLSHELVAQTAVLEDAQRVLAEVGDGAFVRASFIEAVEHALAFADVAGTSPVPTKHFVRV